MKNINALKNFKGNNIVELGEKLLALKTNRPGETFNVDFEVQVWNDNCLLWLPDTTHRENFRRIESTMVRNWKWDVAWHLAYLDKEFPNGWEEFRVQPYRHNNHYAVTVLLRQKTPFR